MHIEKTNNGEDDPRKPNGKKWRDRLCPYRSEEIDESISNGGDKREECPFLKKVALLYLARLEGDQNDADEHEEDKKYLNAGERFSEKE